jgi:hypothetical protein
LLIIRALDTFIIPHYYSSFLILFIWVRLQEYLKVWTSLVEHTDTLGTYLDVPY